MKKSYIFIGGFLIFILIITVVGCNLVTGNVSIKRDRDILSIQSNKEVYFNSYGYSIDNPNVIVNPYGNSPLTGIVMFETNDYSDVSVCIKNKNNECDISYSFGKYKYHIIPIYGLYADYNNSIVLKTEGKEKVINIKTDALPDDFGDVLFDGSFSFYNGNYPYASDSEGNVRWYFNRKYFGSVTFNDNYVIVGNDSYTENGTIGIYRMNLLGKIYNEYLLSDDYYGYSCYYDGNIYALSKDVLVIDGQTGDIISKYENDNYDSIANLDGNILLGRNNEWFSFDEDNNVISVSYSPSGKVYSFYDNSDEYRVFLGVRYGFLKETEMYNRDISILKYDKYTGNDIDVKMDSNRISVSNGTGNKIYLILDKLFDKRIYEISDVGYINLNGLNGKYTIYYKINDKVYKTDYFVEV